MEEQPKEELHNSIKNIKSNIVWNKIFSLILDIKKLDILYRNKHLQNRLKLDINVYKKASGKYKEEENGKSIVYIQGTKQKIYEGEYKNGKKNGYGSEYYFNSLIFEGEYLNGKRNGEGKEYNDLFGDVLFEGEYLNGKRIIGKNDKNINVKK